VFQPDNNTFGQGVAHSADAGFDVAIIGGGTAGSAVALRLARLGHTVVVLEARDLSGSGTEALSYCDTLPAQASSVLEDLGVWDAFVAKACLPSEGTISIWGSATSHKEGLTSEDNGWHVNHQALLTMLREKAAAAGASVCLGSTVQSFSRTPTGRWSLHVYEGVITQQIQARFLVDASGREGIFQPLDGNDSVERKVEDVLIATIWHLAYPSHAPYDDKSYIESTPNGWWYSSPSPDGTASAMFVTDRETFAQMPIALEDLLSEAPLTLLRFKNAVVTKKETAYAPSSYARQISGNAWLAVGDSATCFDLLSGDGLYKALESSDAAAKVVDATLKGQPRTGRSYSEKCSVEFHAYSEQRRRYYASENRWPLAPFWQHRRNKAEVAAENIKAVALEQSAIAV
jgi:flavin-dependent dehydrogenase